MSRSPGRKISVKKRTRKAAAKQPETLNRSAAAGKPLTLEQAKRIALKAPAARLESMSAGMSTMEATPRDIAVARNRYESAKDKERKKERSDYIAVMTLLKKNGALPPGNPARAGLEKASKPFRPLQIFAEGDSWFDYKPFILSGGGVIGRAEKLLGVKILNLAAAGDESRYMLGVEQRSRLIQEFTDGCPVGGPWDAMLFSGGGNDIVDKPMVLWLKTWIKGNSPESHLKQPEFDVALSMVRIAYQELIALRNLHSPSTHLFFHCYDFAFPDKRGVCGYGPWLEPSFTARGFPVSPQFKERRAVVKKMLKQFANMLDLFASSNVTIIKTQGTLPDSTSAWHNELHPSAAGFDMIAQKFYGAIRQKFPDNVS